MEHSGGRLGLPAATALVMGNVIGVGIFTLPSEGARLGTVSILAFGLVSLGALALAVVFGRLAARDPHTGGPYVYARAAFGEFPGFLNAWSYWIASWASNAALVLAWIGYVDVLVPVKHSAALTLTVAIGTMWVAAGINLLGLRGTGAVAVVTTGLKFVPLLFVAVVGLFFVKAENFGPFNATTGGWLTALTAAGAVLLFSFLGVESASIAAGDVRQPERNVMRATVIGTAAAAVVYILGTVAVFGTVPHTQLAGSTASFADAFDHMFGRGAGVIMAVAAVISGFGTLVGWTLICAQMPYAAARDGLFPAAFLRKSRGVPAVGIIVSTALASIILLATYGGGLITAFKVLALITTFTATIPYVFSAAAQVLQLVTGRPVSRARFARDLTVALVAMAFSFWMVAGAGQGPVYVGLLLLLAGIPVYIWLIATRSAQAGGAPTAPDPAGAAPDPATLSIKPNPAP